MLTGTKFKYLKIIAVYIYISLNENASVLQ